MGVKLLLVVHCLTVKKDLPTYSWIFEVLHSKAKELGVQINLAKFVCDFETASILAIQGNFPNIGVHGNKKKDKNGWCNCMKKRARKHDLGFCQCLQLIIDEHGKTGIVVRQMDEGYKRGRGVVIRSSAYGFQQRQVAALTNLFVVDPY
ncbi:hypothetical protein T4C_1615 [Trichinella pseudospiralis]|uniref:MULE transposase domain-containing protein n=1 Tax=Trichinella pseudospiralis TaxID=6337 RepID=A0A0V1JZW5_TRIPS|nr:hypothetical protein T4C_1615 [Trichinella pseudospiralis]